ncbi:MAG: nucleoside-diphosphate-sugar pyrophosphorylase [Desulfobacteraceae bacterium]|nr:MAG: nucleoside-diphosphate-sugar pyrophosphorylase [Desulfobacteraceae bacterium]
MEKQPESVVVVVLAAGKGTRMKSDKAKVLHPVCDRPMILHVVDTATQVAGKEIVIVVGNQSEEVKNVVSQEAEVVFALQQEQRGTGHAVKSALPVLPGYSTQVVILSGDVPLIKAPTVNALLNVHINQKNDITVLGVRLENPFGYGRIIVNNAGDVAKIVEEADATETQKQITIVNSGIYCVKRQFLEISLTQLRSDNRQNEIYLTDIVEVAKNHDKKIGLMICKDETEVLGVNTPQDLLNVESLMIAARK